MADRRIYASQSLFVSNSATGTQTPMVEIHRLQSVGYNFNIARQDVTVFGKLASLSREIIEQPTVGVNFEYLDYNAHNESGLGFIVDDSANAIANIVSGVGDTRNYYVPVYPNDEDAVGSASAANTIAVWGFGNGFINNYSARGQVGGLPSCTVAVEALNVKVDLDASGETVPAVNPTDGTLITGQTYVIPASVTGSGVAALRPGDITVTITTVGQTGIGVDVNKMNIQSYEVTIPMARENLNRLGSKFAFAKKLQFPITATCSVTADIADYQTGSLSNILCNDNSYEVTITMREPDCAGNGDIAKTYTVKNAKLVSQDHTNAIGQNSNVTINFETQIGGATDTENGVFISGKLS